MRPKNISDEEIAELQKELKRHYLGAKIVHDHDLADLISRAGLAIESFAREREWRPIETAPLTTQVAEIERLDRAQKENAE